MDGFDFSAIFAALGGASGVAAIIKALAAQKQAKAITDDRKVSKESYDARFALIEEKVKRCERDLCQGTEKFKLLDERLDEISGTLKELKGMFAMYLKIRSEE